MFGGLGWFGVVPCLSLFVAQAAAAESDARAQAREHFARGVELANGGQYERALQEFTRANDLSPNYSVLYNMGQAYVALGQPVLAVDAFTRYLSEGGARITSERRTEVEATVREQEASIASLEIVTAPNAQVSVDGASVGTAPLSAAVRVKAGEHTVSVQLGDGPQENVRVNASGGRTHRVELALAPPVLGGLAVPAQSTLDIVCPVAQVKVWLDGGELGQTPFLHGFSIAPGTHRVRFAPLHAAAFERSVELLPEQRARVDCGLNPTPAPTSRGTQSTVGYAVGAIGIGVGAAAALHLLWNYSRYKDWQQGSREYEGDPATAQSLNNLATSIDRASTVTVALGIGAGVSLGTSAVLLLTARSQPSASARANTPPLLTIEGQF